MGTEAGAKRHIRVQWVPHHQNAADELTHSTSRSEFTRRQKLIWVRISDMTTIYSLSEG